MRKRSSRKKKPHDPNHPVFRIVPKATVESHQPPAHLPPLADPRPEERSAAAALLGRQGGLKGGPARAKKLSARKRKSIAQKAARARWKGKRSTRGRGSR